MIGFCHISYTDIAHMFSSSPVTMISENFSTFGIECRCLRSFVTNLFIIIIILFSVLKSIDKSMKWLIGQHGNMVNQRVGLKSEDSL